MSASFSYSNLNIDGDDLVKDYTPENQFKLAVTHKVPEVDGLTFGLNYQWQDDTQRVQPTQPSHGTGHKTRCLWLTKPDGDL